MVEVNVRGVSLTTLILFTHTKDNNQLTSTNYCLDVNREEKIYLFLSLLGLQFKTIPLLVYSIKKLSLYVA